MANFIHYPVRQNIAVVADSLVSFDLPSNPLSHILFTLRYANQTANVLHTLANVLNSLDRVSVVADGQALISMNGPDLYAFNCLFLGKEPWRQQVSSAANAVSSLTLIIPFGRRLFDPNECLPAFRRGALQMEIDYATSFTNITSLSEQIEVVQLPSASPQRYVRAISQSLVPTATGQNDMDLPIGNILLGCLIRSTTVPSGTSRTTSANQIRLMVNEVEANIALANWDTLHNSGVLRLLHLPASQHFHLENTAGAYTQNASTGARQYSASDLENYSYADFDPTGDGLYAVSTAGLASLKLRFDTGDTNAIRVVPVELVGLAGAVGGRR